MRGAGGDGFYHLALHGAGGIALGRSLDALRALDPCWPRAFRDMDRTTADKGAAAGACA